jgi:hypothetical protein
MLVGKDMQEDLAMLWLIGTYHLSGWVNEVNAGIEGFKVLSRHAISSLNFVSSLPPTTYRYISSTSTVTNKLRSILFIVDHVERLLKKVL